MAVADKNSPKVRERVFVEKFDHSGSAPRLVEEVAFENGAFVGRKCYDEQGRETEAGEAGTEAETGAAAGAEPGHQPAAVVQGHSHQEVADLLPLRVEPWRAIELVVDASREAGITVEQGMRFLGLLRMGVRAPQGDAPIGPQ